MRNVLAVLIGFILAIAFFHKRPPAAEMDYRKYDGVVCTDRYQREVEPREVRGAYTHIVISVTPDGDPETIREVDLGWRRTSSLKCRLDERNRLE